MSSYIIDRCPDKYGTQQQDYIIQTKTVVQKTAEAFRKAVDEKSNLVELFHKTLACLGETRNQIAIQHGTPNPQLFGIRRDSDPFPGMTAYTPLNSPYEEYNDRLLPVLQKHLRTMKHTVREFQETTLKIPEEPCLGRASSIEFSILTPEVVNKWPQPYEEYKRLCRLCSIPFPENPVDKEGVKNLIHSKGTLQKFKQHSIEDYKRLKLIHVIIPIRERFEGRKSDWILVTVRSEVDGKMYALSQYLTWAYRDFKEDPVEYMTDRSIISLVHQDPFLVDPMLNDIAKIFKKALEWDRKDLKVLKEHVALLQYELAHAMPFARGTAAIAEWLEMALYLYHGYTLSYNPEKMVNLEALTSTLKGFVDNYPSMIRLEKID